MQEHPVTLLTPDHWSTEKCKGITPYDISKFKSEKFLWDYQKSLPEDKKFELVTLCPGLVVGPQLVKAENVGAQGCKTFLEGKGTITNHKTAWVDVRDLA